MTQPDGADSWFAVLPDCPASPTVARLLRQDATRELLYPSGRPWLIGRWTADETTVASSGQGRLVVAGQHPATTESLGRSLSALRGLPDLDRLAAALPGCHHLAAAIGPAARVQGSVSGLRRVFCTRAAGVTVAADSPAVLARLTGAGLDEERLALELMYPRIPDYADTSTLWRGVRLVPPGCCLTLTPDGAGQVTRWWRPPEPDLPAAQGAPLFRDALAAAVSLRAGGRPVISSDLSGGLDSTSLSFLAAQQGARLLAVTIRGADPAHDDAAWADEASRHLPGVQRIIVSPQDLPDRYDRMQELAGGLDDPSEMARDHAAVSHVSALVRAEGAGLHLAGHGGDQILSGYPGFVHSVARGRPWAGFRQLRASRAQYRWPVRESLRGLLDRRDFASWSAGQIGALAAGPGACSPVSLMGWGARVATPPWLTSQAWDIVRATLGAAVAGARPLAPQRGQHAVLEQVRQCAASLRPLAQMMRADGLTLAVPYLDDRVVEAALRVRMDERATPLRYKPLLTRAMDGIVPASVLARTTKGEFSAEVQAGLRRHREELAALFDDPVLGRLGLIDAAAARGAVLGRYPDLPPRALLRTLACEIWLRAHRQAPREHARRPA